MRFTVIDAEGTVSAVGPGHAMKMLAAACSKQPADHRTLLGIAEDFDPGWAGAVLAALSRFDQVWLPRDAATLHARLDEFGDEDAVVFRVVDEATRRRSLEPARAGLVVYNLIAKRIVQVQNSYGDLRRRDRGRLRRDGRPVRAYYSYVLPADWTIVP